MIEGMIKLNISELFEKNDISYKMVDCSGDIFFSALPTNMIQYFNCMGSTISLNKTTYGSSYTTLFSVKEIKDEQSTICTKNNLLVIGYGLNGDLLTYSLSNGKVGYVFHDELGEEIFDVFEDIYVEMPFGIQEFLEMAIENENYPIDGTMAEELIKTL